MGRADLAGAHGPDRASVHRPLSRLPSTALQSLIDSCGSNGYHKRMNRTPALDENPAAAADQPAHRTVLALVLEAGKVSAETALIDGTLVLEAAREEPDKFSVELPGMTGGESNAPISVVSPMVTVELLRALTDRLAGEPSLRPLLTSNISAYWAEIVDDHVVGLRRALETVANEPIFAAATETASQLVLQLAGSVAALSPSLASKEGPAVSPQVAYALAEEEQDLRDIEEEFGWFDSGGVAEQMGKKRNRTLASSLRAKGQLLGYARRGQQAVRYPRFQFDGKGILPVIPELIRVADENKVAHEDLLFWICAPTGMLEDDARPVDILRTDPDRVLAAARYDLGEQAW